MKILNMVIYLYSYALLQFYLNLQSFMSHKAACHLTKCDVLMTQTTRIYHESEGETVANIEVTSQRNQALDIDVRTMMGDCTCEAGCWPMRI